MFLPQQLCPQLPLFPVTSYGVALCPGSPGRLHHPPATKCCHQGPSGDSLTPPVTTRRPRLCEAQCHQVSSKRRHSDDVIIGLVPPPGLTMLSLARTARSAVTWEGLSLPTFPGLCLSQDGSPFRHLRLAMPAREQV